MFTVTPSATFSIPCLIHTQFRCCFPPSKATFRLASYFKLFPFSFLRASISLRGSYLQLSTEFPIFPRFFYCCIFYFHIFYRIQILVWSVFVLCCSSNNCVLSLTKSIKSQLKKNYFFYIKHLFFISFTSLII